LKSGLTRFFCDLFAHNLTQVSSEGNTTQDQGIKKGDEQPESGYQNNKIIINTIHFSVRKREYGRISDTNL
jgi:hypothetical protein